MRDNFEAIAMIVGFAVVIVLTVFVGVKRSKIDAVRENAIGSRIVLEGDTLTVVRWSSGSIGNPHGFVLSNGTVIPCCLDSEGVISLGNIFDEKIENILNSERATKIHEGFTARVGVEELCKRCGYATRFKRK